MANSNGNTFSFIPHLWYFSYHLSIAASEARSLTTLFSTEMREEETQSQEHRQTCLSNLLLLYAWEVMYLINKGVISPYVQEQGEMLLKFNILHLHYVTHYSAIELNASLFKAALWSIKRSTLCAIWENNLETFEKLFSMIQSGCSIHSYFLKPLHWNIHELRHKVPKTMKIIAHSFRASNWTLDLLSVLLKFSWLLGYIFLNLFFISHYFFKFRNDLYIIPEIGVMIQQKLKENSYKIVFIKKECKLVGP